MWSVIIWQTSIIVDKMLNISNYVIKEKVIYVDTELTIKTICTMYNNNILYALLLCVCLIIIKWWVVGKGVRYEIIKHNLNNIEFFFDVFIIMLVIVAVVWVLVTRW